jgi:hypothetical protein
MLQMLFGWVIGILFFVMIPLVLLMRRPTGPRTMVVAE